MTQRLLALLLAAALALAACSNGDPAPGATTSAPGAVEELALIPQASYDLAAGTNQRLLFGVQLADRSLIGGGTLDTQVIALDAADAVEGTLVTQGPATFLPVPGMAPQPRLDAPTPIDGRRVSGVYQLRTDLPTAGFYGLQVRGTLADGRAVAGTAVFVVAESPLVVAPGEPAPRTTNPTPADDVPLVALDSCAQEGNPCDPANPDAPPSLRFPWLHETVIAEAIDAGRPVVVVVSTPVYCVSRFCGPITDNVADLAEEYGDRAAFVHLEVWQDFNERALNPAAAEWIQHPDGSALEPWTFLVGADGLVAERWGNVLDLAELTGLLEALPAGE